MPFGVSGLLLLLLLNSYAAARNNGARKPETTIVNQLLHADNIPGRPL